MTLLFAVLATAMAQSDDIFQFVKADGTVVPDGATITVTDLVEDEFLGNNINSGLHVKNISDVPAYVRVSYEIASIDNGSFQICFPVTCNSQFATGVYQTAAGAMDAETELDLQSEWFPEAYGRCAVTFRLEVMELTGMFPRQSYTKLADGPAVTVVFNYDDPAAITPHAFSPQASSLQPSSSPLTHRYDLLGRHHSSSAFSGFVITPTRKYIKR